jgi:hypothetical protein
MIGRLVARSLTALYYIILKQYILNMFIVWWQVDFFWKNSRGTNFKGNSMSVSSYSQTGTSHRPNDFFNTILFYHHYAYSTTDTSSARNFNYFNISFPRTLHVSG